MKRLVYLYTLLYVFFVLQGVLSPRASAFTCEEEALLSSDSELHHLQQSKDYIHHPTFSFVVDDDDDQESKRRLLALSSKRIQKAITFYKYGCVYALGHNYCPHISLFFTDASPPVIV